MSTISTDVIKLVLDAAANWPKDLTNEQQVTRFVAQFGADLVQIMYDLPPNVLSGLMPGPHPGPHPEPHPWPQPYPPQPYYPPYIPPFYPPQPGPFPFPPPGYEYQNVDGNWVLVPIPPVYGATMGGLVDLTPFIPAANAIQAACASAKVVMDQVSTLITAGEAYDAAKVAAGTLPAGVTSWLQMVVQK